MTIKELLLAIRGLPEDMQIVLAKDAEGNAHSPLADISVGNYEPRTSWDGDFVTTDGEGDELAEDQCNALCLEPAN